MKATHTCVVKIQSPKGITCCGQPATLYDRAKKDWICTDHHRERCANFANLSGFWRECKCELIFLRHPMRSGSVRLARE